MPQFTRQTAIPCTLAEIASGSFLQNDTMPSGIQTGRGMISRASIIGVMIDKQDKEFSIDDGTNVINVRSFDTNPVPVYANVGDIVLVIGRPREYNGQRYLVLEICKKIRNNGWIQYRKKELSLLTQPKVEVKEETPAESKNPFEALVAAIRDLDKGPGADIDVVLARVDAPDANKFLRTLIEEGEIFEIRPGKLKVLE